MRYIFVLCLTCVITQSYSQDSYKTRIKQAKSSSSYAEKTKALLSIVEELKNTAYVDTLADAIYFFTNYNSRSKVFPMRQVEICNLGVESYESINYTGYRILRMNWYAAKQLHLDGKIQEALTIIHKMDEYPIEDDRDMEDLVRAKILVSQIYRKNGDDGVGINLLEYLIHHEKFNIIKELEVKHRCFLELSICYGQRGIDYIEKAVELLDSASVYETSHYKQGQIIHQKAVYYKMKNDFIESYDLNLGAFDHYSKESYKLSLEGMIGATINGIDDLTKMEIRDGSRLLEFADDFLDSVSVYQKNLIPLMTNRLSYATVSRDIEKCNEVLDKYSDLGQKMMLDDRDSYIHLAEWYTEVANYHHELYKDSELQESLLSAFTYSQLADDYTLKQDAVIKTKEGIYASRTRVKKIYEVGIEIAASLDNQEWFFYCSEKTKNAILHDQMEKRVSSDTREYEILSSLSESSENETALRNELRLIRKDKINELDISKNRKIINPISFDDFVNLSSDRVVFNYCFGLDSLYLQVIDHNGSMLYTLGETEKIEEKVGSFEMSHQSEVGDLIKLPQPIVNQIKLSSRPILMIPDGLLFRLPTEVLHGLEDGVMTTSYAHSASIYNDMQSADVSIEETIVIAPKYDETRNNSGSTKAAVLYNLPFSKSEAEEIVDKVVNGKVVETKYDISQLLKDYNKTDIMHYTGHAIAVDDADLSYLPLGNKVEDRLYGYQIQQLKTTAKLVVLNACNTGTGAVVDGDGVHSLTTSFILSGTSSLISSLWPIEDQSSYKIMSKFYDNLIAGESKSLALSNAKNDFLSSCPDYQKHPYYWAGIVLSGDDSPLIFAKKSSIDIYLLISLLIIFLLGFLYWNNKKN